ncbi:isopenicillin N synthase family oxygenase, partial [Campylobacter jejuni]|uniref:isopenicillin N synthase family oxygenase n=1 Tax=Campylobacter jejuni TaxID=197 RepID=UPI0018F870CA
QYPKSSKNIIQGVVSHKDGGFSAFVIQQNQRQLEVVIDGKWLSIHPHENSVVVNIGEFLDLATNGNLKATIHRVNLIPKERFS